MKFAQKFHMITPQQYAKLKGDKDKGSTDGIFLHPDVKAATNEHNTMKQISSSQELSDYDKVLQHSEALQRYLNHFRDAIVLPKQTAIIGNKREQTPVIGNDRVPKSQQEDVVSHVTKQEENKAKHEKFSPKGIVQSLSSSKKKTAVTRLIDGLLDSPAISWDSTTGKVNINGKKLKGTDITTLLSDAVGDSDPRSQNALKFHRVLQDLGLKRKLKTRKQTGKGLPRLSKIDLRKWISI